MDSEEQVEDLGTFRISVFFEKHYQLFAILSVFGATSAYLHEFGDIGVNRVPRIGFVSALLLLFLTALIINWHFYREIGKMTGLIKSLLQPSQDTYELASLFILFNALTLSLLGITGEYKLTIGYIGQFVAIVLGLVGPFQAIRFFSRRADREELENDDLTDYILLHGFFGLILSLPWMYILREEVGGLKTAIIISSTFPTGTPAIGTSLIIGIIMSGMILLALSLVGIIYYIKGFDYYNRSW